MLDFIKVIILGIVEGLTEFLPISSTGHLIVASALLGYAADRPEYRSTFEIFIQLGAVLAVVAYYWRDIFRQVTQVSTDAGVRRFWIDIVVAFIPAAVIGILVKNWVKANLFTPTVVALALIVGGVLFLIVERMKLAERASTKTLTAITLPQALTVGIAQILAVVFPGFSRSGATIVGGMVSGMDRPTATQFTFYLAIPTLGLATIFDLLTSLKSIQSGDIAALLLGLVVSAIVAWFSIGWLLRYVARHSFNGFGYYRIVAGLVILALVAAHVL
jgi:undecaprenyl-diphosphatase